MSVEQEQGAGHEAWVHGRGILGVQLDEDETVPGGAIAFRFGFQLAQIGLFEFEDVKNEVGGNEGTGGRGGIGEHDIFELVRTGRQDRGAFIDLGGIEQVEDGEVLDGKDLVHALDAEATLAIEEIGDMGLFESGLLGESEAGKFSCLNALPQDLAQVLLQQLELH